MLLFTSLDERRISGRNVILKGEIRPRFLLIKITSTEDLIRRIFGMYIHETSYRGKPKFHLPTIIPTRKIRISQTLSVDFPATRLWNETRNKNELEKRNDRFSLSNREKNLYSSSSERKKEREKEISQTITVGWMYPWKGSSETIRSGEESISRATRADDSRAIKRAPRTHKPFVPLWSPCPVHLSVTPWIEW